MNHQCIIYNKILLLLRGISCIHRIIIFTVPDKIIIFEFLFSSIRTNEEEKDTAKKQCYQEASNVSTH